MYLRSLKSCTPHVHTCIYLGFCTTAKVRRTYTTGLPALYMYMYIFMLPTCTCYILYMYMYISSDVITIHSMCSDNSASIGNQEWLTWNPAQFAHVTYTHRRQWREWHQFVCCYMVGTEHWVCSPPTLKSKKWNEKSSKTIDPATCTCIWHVQPVHVHKAVCEVRV